MAVEIFYISSLLVVIGITFLFFKRPIYECMFYGYILMIGLTGEWENILFYIKKTSRDTLFYSIVAFLVLAKILDMTGAVDKIVAIVMSLFGKIPGGAAYTAVIVSTFMGALSGSGAGNVATTGIFTIPAMKKTGFKPHIAANIEAAASTMGNMIPPSAGILASLACYNEFSGQEMSQSLFWIVVWGIAIWFILQRLLTVFVFCKLTKVKLISNDEVHPLNETIKEGGIYLLLPIIILLPFIIDYFFKDRLFTDRLGLGAAKFSSSILLFTPGVAAILAIFLARKQENMNIREIINTLGSSINSIVPVSATIFFAYCISNVFASTDIGNNVGIFINKWQIPRVAMCFIIPLLTAILGMILPGTAQTKIFGTTIISALVTSGVNPLIAAAMLPAMTGAMEGITPPLALCTYTAMGIAESDFKKTTYNAFIWVGLHYIMCVICMLGFLPIIGV